MSDLVAFLEQSRPFLRYAYTGESVVDLEGKCYMAVIDYLGGDRLMIATFDELEGPLEHDGSLHDRLVELLGDVDEFNTSN